MHVTIELMIASDTAEDIVIALDAIANKVSDVGYTDSEFTHVGPGDGYNNATVQYRIVRGLVR